MVNFDFKLSDHLTRVFHTSEPCLARNVTLYSSRTSNALSEIIKPGWLTMEVGVARGDHSWQFMTTFNPRKHIMVDAWVHQENYRDSCNTPDADQQKTYEYVVSRFKRQVEDGRAEIRRGLSLEVLAKVPPGSINLIYIDANHDYGPVLDDLTAAAKCLSADGILCGHDWMWGSACVRKAVTEFCLAENWELFAFGLFCGSYYLRKR